MDGTVDHVTNVTMPTVTWSQEFGETNINVDVRRSLRNSFDVSTGITVLNFHHNNNDVLYPLVLTQHVISLHTQWRVQWGDLGA